MYVAVKGGEKAIANAHALQENRRRGNETIAELSVAQIEQQMNLAVDRVMTEGGIADRELAALALKQASGDNVEAIFLLRAYRTTLAKVAVSEPVNSAEMRLERRISAVYKDIPGGQLLGPTYDYTHRLLDFTLLANGETPPCAAQTTRRTPLRTSFPCWPTRDWQSVKRMMAPRPTTSPARHRFTPVQEPHVCNS